jgi:hypothetical protein
MVVVWGEGGIDLSVSLSGWHPLRFYDAKPQALFSLVHEREGFKEKLNIVPYGRFILSLYM